MFSEAWRVYRCFLLCWEPVSPGNRISRRAGPRADWALPTPRWWRGLNGCHRKPRVFQGVLGPIAARRGARLDTHAHGVHTHAHLPTPRAPWHPVGLRPAAHGLLGRLVVQIQPAGREHGAWRGGPPVDPWARAGGWRAPRWRRGAAAAPGVGGCDDAVPPPRELRPLKAEETALSRRWLHWRQAHPGLTLKKPNCLLQREKATSCRRPCSGKNVSGLAVAVGAESAREGLGFARHPGAGEVRGAGGGGTGSGVPVPSQGSSRGEVGKMERGGETNLSEVMLIFQAGGERTSVPRGDSSSCLRCLHESLWWRKGSWWFTKHNLGGKAWSSLPECLYFYKQLLYPVVQFRGPVSLWVTELSDKGTMCLCDCIGTMWKLGLSSLSSPALLSFSCHSSSPLVARLVCPRAMGRGFTSNLNVYPWSWMEHLWTLFSICGTEQRLVLLIIEITQRLSTTFLSQKNKVNSMASWELNLPGAQFCTSSRKK